LKRRALKGLAARLIIVGVCGAL